MKHILILSMIMLVASPGIAMAECGKASWYAMTTRTASGANANPASMTAAHRTLPFGSKVRVTNLRNGKSVVVTINDRGPFVRGRIIDVTKAVATELGFRWSGWTRVGISKTGAFFHRGRKCRKINEGATLGPKRIALPKQRPETFVPGPTSESDVRKTD